MKNGTIVQVADSSVPCFIRTIKCFGSSSLGTAKIGSQVVGSVLYTHQEYSVPYATRAIRRNTNYLVIVWINGIFKKAKESFGKNEKRDAFTSSLKFITKINDKKPPVVSRVGKLTQIILKTALQTKKMKKILSKNNHEK